MRPARYERCDDNIVISDGDPLEFTAIADELRSLRHAIGPEAPVTAGQRPALPNGVIDVESTSR